MRQFVLKILIFIFPILVIALLMEFSLRHIPNDYIYKKEYLDRNCRQIRTLILGSSHSYYGINPIYFTSNTFNASHISQSLDYDFEIFKKYETELNNLENIIIPISYSTLYSKLAKGIESWRVKNYEIYYNINFSHLSMQSLEILSQKWSISLMRIYSFYLRKQTEISCSELGWGTNYKSLNAKNLIETGKIAAKRHTYNIHSDNIQTMLRENLFILNSIITKCREKNINVILLTTPTYETYRKNLNIEQLNLTLKTVDKIISEYDNCAYINWLDNDAFEAKDFYDADHLSETGAEKLSLFLNNILTHQ
jgi:hypothetical protein